MLIYQGQSDPSKIALQPDPQYVEKSGWGFFSEEVSWFLYSFFTTRLDNEEKLIFFSYFLNGMTLQEIAERLQISFQAVHRKLKIIEEHMRHSWKYGDSWIKKELPKDREV